MVLAGEKLFVLFVIKKVVAWDIPHKTLNPRNPTYCSFEPITFNGA